MSVRAIIAGSGFDVLDGFAPCRAALASPYGAPSATPMRGALGAREWIFLPRHSSDHSIAPHRINYRANLHALHQLGVTEIVSIAAVGGIAAHLAPRTIVIPDQLIDYTWGRAHTFFDDEVRHIDFTAPYSPSLRARLIAAADRAKVPVNARGVYAVTQGPRLETAAEIVRLARDGADVVGMTAMPEAALARELAMEYAAIAVVVNYAAGQSEEALDMRAIGENLTASRAAVLEIIARY